MSERTKRRKQLSTHELSRSLRDIGQLSNIKTSPFLYHYTGAQALESIIQRKELWLTHASYQNDISELQYSKSVATDCLRTLSLPPLNENDITHNSVFLNEQQYVDDFKPYLLSLTTDRDCFPLWVNYGKDDGYNIGFDTEKLYTHLRALKPKLPLFTGYPGVIFSGMVLYNEAHQRELISFLLSKRYEYKRNGDDRRMKQIELKLIITQYFIKNPVFEAEREFRIVILLLEKPKNTASTPEASVSHIHYRNHMGAMVPYIKIPLYPTDFVSEVTEDNEEDRKRMMSEIKAHDRDIICLDDTPIRHLTIGPRNSNDQCESGAIGYLRAKGSVIKNDISLSPDKRTVMRSKIPLRF